MFVSLIYHLAWLWSHTSYIKKKKLQARKERSHEGWTRGEPRERGDEEESHAARDRGHSAETEQHVLADYTWQRQRVYS